MKYVFTVLILLSIPLQAQWRPIRISSSTLPEIKAIQENFRRASLWSNRKMDKYAQQVIYGTVTFISPSNQYVKITGDTMTGPLVVQSTVTAYYGLFVDHNAPTTFPTISGVGGTTVTYSDSDGVTWVYHVFITSAQFYPPTGLTLSKYLVVGMGGNGGAGTIIGNDWHDYEGGGGGGGQVVEGVMGISGQMTVVVATSPNMTSSFGGVTAVSGGAGGGALNGYVGIAGANGGGGSGGDTTNANGASSTIGRNWGGIGWSGGGSGGGGGMGRGALGQNGYGDVNGGTGGRGGDGVMSTITGTPVYYGGGGGGGMGQSTVDVRAVGGLGGGGTGGLRWLAHAAYDGTDGTAYTGGGGGGGRQGGATSGGSGVVIISYPLNTNQALKNTVLYSSGNVVIDGDLTLHGTLTNDRVIYAQNFISSVTNLNSLAVNVSTITSDLSAYKTTVQVSTASIYSQLQSTGSALTQEILDRKSAFANVRYTTQTVSTSLIDFSTITSYANGLMANVRYSTQTVSTSLIDFSTLQPVGNYVTSTVTYLADGVSLALAGATFSAKSSSVTLQGNSFNGANQLVQMTSATKLPAVDGSLLTGLTAIGDNLGNHIATTTLDMATFPIIGAGSITATSATVTGNLFSVGGSTLVVQNGKIRIGTTTVAGGIVRIQGPLATAADLLEIYSDNTHKLYEFYGSASGYGEFVMRGPDGTGQGTALIDINANGDSWFNGGNVAIGKTTPTTALDVNGVITASSISITGMSTVSGQPFIRLYYNTGTTFITNGTQTNIFWAGQSGQKNITWDSVNSSDTVTVDYAGLYMINCTARVNETLATGNRAVSIWTAGARRSEFQWVPNTDVYPSGFTSWTSNLTAGTVVVCKVEVGGASDQVLSANAYNTHMEIIKLD